jgi:hypothetical protein
MKYVKISKFFILITFIAGSISVYAQNDIDGSGNNILGGENTITTAVPLLMISPDSRASGLGDAGVATTPDANSMHWNPAKYAFVENDMGVSISYTPWLNRLVDDINLAYLTGYKRLDDRQTVAVSLLYFSLGVITFTDYSGSVITNFDPKEFSVDLAYSRQFSDVISASLSGRFIYSNLTGGLEVEGSQSHAGIVGSTDISVFYQNDINVADYDSKLAFGLNLSNLGGKIGYTEDSKTFIPMNMRLGSALTMNLDEYNTIMVTADLNKLLVPTPPYYYTDSIGDDGNQVIRYGKSPDVSVPVAMFQSFYDAPGVAKSDGSRSVLQEELREITYSIGAEYWYAKQFAVRAGYFHEHETKGNRKFFTFGIGLKMNVFGLDVSYLIPTIQHHPLENTLRFSLLFDIDAFSNQE